MKQYLQKVFSGESLTEAEAFQAMELLMEGATTPEEVGAFLGALRGKGESVAEITGCSGIASRGNVRLCKRCSGRAHLLYLAGQHDG